MLKSVIYLSRVPRQVMYKGVKHTDFLIPLYKIQTIEKVKETELLFHLTSPIDNTSAILFPVSSPEGTNLILKALKIAYIQDKHCIINIDHSNICVDYV